MRQRANAEARASEEHAARLRALEQERADLEERLSALARVSSDGIVQVDSEGYVTDMNAAARSFLGVSDGLDRPLRQLSWGLDLHPLVSQAIGEGGGGVVSQTVVRDDRAFFVSALALGQGDERGALVGISEVTELQRLGRARREFVANISHELRTPVTSLQLLADTIDDRVLNDKVL